MGTREIYSGTQRKPVVKISGLVRNVDFTVSYENNINPGKATAIIKGKGSYIGTVTKTFTIYRKMSTLEAELEYANSEYDGKEKTPKVKIAGLTEGKDYTVSYANNVNVGEATITITGTGNYRGSITKTFEIKEEDKNKVDISKYEAKLDKDSYKYTGSSIKPKVTIEGLEEIKILL